MTALQRLLAGLLITASLMVFGFLVTHAASNSAFIGYVKYTLDLCNNKLYIGQYTPTCNYQPTQMLYLKSTGYIYVDDHTANAIFVISPKTNKIIKTIQIGSCKPLGMTYDPVNGYIYVACIKSNTIAVINPARYRVVATISSPYLDGPITTWYDPVTGYIYVWNAGNNKIVIINPTINSVVGLFPYGGVGIIYNPINGYLYVLFPNGTYIIINQRTNETVTEGSLGFRPSLGAFVHNGASYIAYMISLHSLYVVKFTNIAMVVLRKLWLGNNITATLIIPTSMAYDPRNGYLYIAGHGKVIVINPSTGEIVGTISVGGPPNYVFYNPANGYIYVLNSGSGSISIISTTLQTSQPPITTYAIVGIIVIIAVIAAVIIKARRR